MKYAKQLGMQNANKQSTLSHSMWLKGDAMSLSI